VAVYRETAIHWYVGHSDDEKPAGAPVGSRFFAFDTPAWWVFDGDEWRDQTV
jgi:hypothetical protein